MAVCVSELGLLNLYFILSLQGCILKKLLLFTFLKHGIVYLLTSLIVLPAVWIGHLLPLAVFHPNTSVCLVLDRKSSFGHCFIPLLHFTLHEVCIILLCLEPKLQSILAFAAPRQCLVLQCILSILFIVQVYRQVMYQLLCCLLSICGGCLVLDWFPLLVKLLRFRASRPVRTELSV